MKKIWVNGTFDVLHIGHINLLKFANSLGIVRVGIDSDERVTKLKGKSRPYNNISNRKLFLESLKFVDSVVVFNDENDLETKILDWESNIIVIGSDYKNKKIIGSNIVEEIIYFERIIEYSTSDILSYDKNINNW